jgi:hypothetical protein
VINPTQKFIVHVERTAEEIAEEIADFGYPVNYVLKGLDAEFCQAWVNDIATDPDEMSDWIQEEMREKFGVELNHAVALSDQARVAELLKSGSLSSTVLTDALSRLDGSRLDGSTRTADPQGNLPGNDYKIALMLAHAGADISQSNINWKREDVRALAKSKLQTHESLIRRLTGN